MANNKAIEDILVCPSQNSLITFQSFIRNSSLKPQEIRLIQRGFTAALKEKEKENCDLILEAMQVFIQKYHDQLMEWLYILIVQLIQRQASATHDTHIRALQETTDLIRNLFSPRLLLQLTCKFVMDSVQIINSTIKFNLLQFFRVLVVSSKPEILDNTFPDLIMAVSRLLSWTADIKSMKVRKESERVIQKLYYLNPGRFSTILKTLPSGFQERAKIILNIPTTLTADTEEPKVKSEPLNSSIVQAKDTKGNAHLMNVDKSEGPYPKPGLFEKNQAGYILSTKDKNNDVLINGAIESSVESIPTNLAHNGATVTYKDANHIRHKLKKLKQYKQLLDSSQTNCKSESCDIIRDKKFQTKKSKSRNFSKDEIKDTSESLCVSKSKDNGTLKLIQVNNLPENEVSNDQDIETLLKDITQKLSRFNERHQERKLSLLSLIKCINSNENICWDNKNNFKTIMSLLLETLGDNEGGTRKLAVIAIQELAKVEPDRFQDQMLLIVEKLISCFQDTDQGVIEAVKSCSVTFACYLNVDSLWRTLNIVLVDSEEGIQAIGLKFMSYVIRASTPVIVACLLVETLSLLHKFTLSKNMQLRKNSIYCLITLYKKIGDKIWPNLKNFEKTTVRLLQIYIHRL